MHPVLFTIFGVPVHAYGVMLACAFLGAIWIASRQVKEAGGDPEHISNMAIYVVILSMIGARLFHCFVFWDHYKDNPLQILNVREGGLVYYGGLIGGAIAGLAYLRRQKLPLAMYSDFVAPGIAFGLGTARIGCFLAGCCHGKTCPADFPFGVTFPPQSVGLSGVPLYPTQFAESILSYAICLFLYFVVRPRKRFHGQVIASFLVLYGLARIGLEFFRADPRGFMTLFHVSATAGLTAASATGLWKLLLATEALFETGPGLYAFRLSESQVVSLLLFGVSAVLWATLRKTQAVSKMIPAGAPAAKPNGGGDRARSTKKGGKKKR
ncbi:MAG: prolipoprotein diacylglyceryl transferase [Deltaproteobacteria bacterium]|nr:prolipoprotein diacylglyceryl transferase [Deltaproteobacteria bacterium]